MIKEDTLKKDLVKLGPELLAEKLINFSKTNRVIAKELELLALKNDPQKLFNKINQQINAIKRSKRFIQWNETHLLTDELYQITNAIEHDLLSFSPPLAIELIETLFNMDESLCERADDSNGELGIFYYSLAELWGKVCNVFGKNNTINLPAKVFELLLHDNYGVRNHIIKHSSNALGEEGLKQLEILIKKNEKQFKIYSLSSLYQTIAEASGDVDKYIAAIKEHSMLNEITVCDIAEKLIVKWRSVEAIDWLLHQPDNVALKDSPQQYDPQKVTLSRRYDVLLKAYDSETMTQEAQSLRWLLFQKSLSMKYYEGLLKYQSAQNLAEIKARAFRFACEEYKGNINYLLDFLANIQEYVTLNNIVIAQYESLSEYDYSLYRPLSKNLSTAGYPLSACLLRRKLVNGIINRGQSKYYKYAASDLKISQRYAESVNDWQGIPEHNEYMALLKSRHSRKAAFWALVEQSGNTEAENEN